MVVALAEPPPRRRSLLLTRPSLRRTSRRHPRPPPVAAPPPRGRDTVTVPPPLPREATGTGAPGGHRAVEPDPYPAPSPRALATLSLPCPFPTSAGNPAIMAPPPTPIHGCSARRRSRRRCRATARDCAAPTYLSPPPAIAVTFVATDGATPRLQHSRGRTHQFP